jgi:TolB-like protein/tetratricopeptide (TPR) repeat protein
MHDDILRQLKKITGSPEFLVTKRQLDFLNFVVSETLHGRSADLKGYLVATKVFGRTAEFDASTDPIVSIQANKLRRALERYYLVEGQRDPIRIDIPKGAYVPSFGWMKPVKADHTQSDSELEPLPEDSWPTILVKPFKNMTGDPEQGFWGTRISAELAIEISCFDNVRVIYPHEDDTASDSTGEFRFLLDGQLFRDNEVIKLSLYLHDTKTQTQLWGHTCSTGLGTEEIFSFTEQVVRGVAVKVCGEFGIITKVIGKESRDKPLSTLNSYEALSRFWEYEQNLDPESFKRALEALTHAVQLEPESPQILGSLAILYGTIHILDIDGFANPLGQAVEYAEKAAFLNPNNQRILGILALVRLYSSELAAAINEAHRALDLNPNSLFVLDGLGWILTFSGDWENGPCLAEKAIRLNPYHRAIAHDALWLDYLRQQKLELAHEEAFNRQRLWLFWDPLIKASTLGLLGKEKEGQRYARKLLQLRPDFPQKGRRLIGNLIKFEEITSLIEEGLRRVGLDIS